MFGLFKSSNQAEEEFIVFKSKEEKYRMIFRSLSESLEFQTEIFLIYFFKDTGSDLLKLCKASGIVFCHNRKPDKSREILSIWSHDEFIKQQVQVSDTIISSEFYPMRSRNKHLLELAGKDNTVLFYSELDNAYFKAIGMENVIAIVDRLGIKENEPISHTMVGRSIVRSQENFEKKISNEKETSNLDHWILFNVKI